MSSNNTQALTSTKPARPFKPSKEMILWADTLVELVNNGKPISEKIIRDTAGIPYATVWTWRKRRPIEFAEWLRSYLCVQTPAVYGSIAQAALNHGQQSHTADAKLYLQVMENWSEKQTIDHNVSGTIDLVPGANDVSHRIAAARQEMEAIEDAEEARRKAESIEVEGVEVAGEGKVEEGGTPPERE